MTGATSSGGAKKAKAAKKAAPKFAKTARKDGNGRVIYKSAKTGDDRVRAKSAATGKMTWRKPAASKAKAKSNGKAKKRDGIAGGGNSASETVEEAVERFHDDEEFFLNQLLHVINPSALPKTTKGFSQSLEYTLEYVGDGPNLKPKFSVRIGDEIIVFQDTRYDSH